jgi:Na+/H+-dicarboxylate symporter
VLVGLVAGFALGLALAGSSSPVATGIVAFLAPVGTLFVNLIRMTVIPLVTSMLIASIGTTAASGTLGRVGVRAAIGAVALLLVAAVFTVVVSVPVMSRVNIDQSAAMALRGPDASRPADGGGRFRGGGRRAGGRRAAMRGRRGPGPRLDGQKSCQVIENPEDGGSG